MNNRLHTIAFRHMTCGCQPDDEAGFMLVCNMHLYAAELLSACLDSSQLLDARIIEAMAKSCGPTHDSTASHDS